MAYKNFKIETDSDGIALVTWDIPGKSMNVVDETSGIEHGNRHGSSRSSSACSRRNGSGEGVAVWREMRRGARV